MSRVRRVWCGISVFLLVAAVAAITFQRPIKLAYHKYALRSAKAESLRLKQQGPGPLDEFKALFRSKPWTSRECAAVAERHARELVRLGFLQRVEIAIGADDFAAKDSLMRQLDEMNRLCPWWTYSAPKGATSVVIMACARGMAKWQEKAEGLAMCAESCCSKGNQWVASTQELHGF